MCETWGRIRMRIGIILMPIRIRIWISIQHGNLDPDRHQNSKRCQSTTLSRRFKKIKKFGQMHVLLLSPNTPFHSLYATFCKKKTELKFGAALVCRCWGWTTPPPPSGTPSSSSPCRARARASSTWRSASSDRTSRRVAIHPWRMRAHLFFFTGSSGKLVSCFFFSGVWKSYKRLRWDSLKKASLLLFVNFLGAGAEKFTVLRLLIKWGGRLDSGPGVQKCPTKIELREEILCFEVLDVLFWGLKAFTVDWTPFMEA